MKKIILIISFLLILPLAAEQGEFQIFAGAGAYIPLKQYTQDKTVYIYSSYNIPLELYFGITDNFDIGIHGSFSRLTDTNIDKEYNGISGREYFDYQHVNLDVQLRYNFLPGFIFFAPHLIVGVGNNIETYRNREFYLNDNELYNNYDEEDYTKGNLNFQGGIDITSRIWWIFMLRVEALYNYSINGSQYMELNAYIGIDWMIKSYGGR